LVLALVVLTQQSQQSIDLNEYPEGVVGLLSLEELAYLMVYSSLH
jgi:hypothetical protein